MGISVKEFLFGKRPGKAREISCQELLDAAQEVHIRELALATCVNMIANAIGRCEFKTFRERKEIKEAEYYLWNIEPNINQNSSDFIHEMIDKLIRENEVLIISTKHRDGHEMLVIADEFQKSEKYPAKMAEYTNVKVGEVTYSKTFRESDVMHLRLNIKSIREVIDGLYGSYYKLLQTAQKGYNWGNGVHLKVKVNQIAEGEEDFAANFQKLMTDQVKPWMDSGSGVLPEFDGYEYSNDLANKQGSAQQTTRDIRALVNDIFDFTAIGVGIPPVLVKGEVADTKDAMTRWLTTGIDPIVEQIQEEAIRKRYGRDAWIKGDYLHIDTTTIVHFDMFSNATNVEKLIGSGAYSINDVLAAAGQPEIDADWANLHWLTLNIGTMEAAAKAAENQGKGGKA